MNKPMSVRSYVRRSFAETAQPRLALWMGGWSVAVGLLTQRGAVWSIGSITVGLWFTWIGRRSEPR